MSAERWVQSAGAGLASGVLANIFAWPFSMGWRRFTEIRAWQLSIELSEKVHAFLARSAARSDRRFCEEARAAADSAPRNIAEGFGRFGPRQFANFVNIARASQLETQTNLVIAHRRGYLTETEFNALWKLSEETVATTTGLLNRLRRQDDSNGPA